MQRHPTDSPPVDTLSLHGQCVDVINGRCFGARIVIEAGKIAAIEPDDSAPSERFFMPGFVDAHVHIESSLLTPVEFARAAVVHGTVATVSDPHEIANVCGVEGVHWMLANAAHSPFKCYFGAPSCVPATPFESAGAAFDLATIEQLLADERIRYLAEVMNFPAVIAGDPNMLAIIDAAKRLGKNIDGHAPGVVGEALQTYAARGIETDHECVTLDEARQRIACGMHVAIREGSAARNFDALWPLLKESPAQCFFCSDDKHPDALVVSHINGLVARAVANGVPTMDAIRAATLNPIRHYKLPVGLLRVGDPADCIEVSDLRSFNVRATYINGRQVSKASETLLPPVATRPINRFAAQPIDPNALAMFDSGNNTLPVIVAKDGQLLTGREDLQPTMDDGRVVADPQRDLLKIVVLNRYQSAPPALALIRNFGLKTGAMASSVAHDSHNIVAVGADDAQLTAAINAVVECGGGLAFCSPHNNCVYPLPVAGLMGLGDAQQAATAFTELTDLARGDGCTLRSPYMTLSFMALLVIPSLKISDRGLFDVDAFALL
jgi:adenine deaminase